MPYLTYFSESVPQVHLPIKFPSPFSNIPHPLARQASLQLQEVLLNQPKFSHDFDAPDGGKMFGILLVKDSNDKVGFLSAFSGKLAGQWQQPGFVPPMFDEIALDNFLPAGEETLALFTAKIVSLTESRDYQKLTEMLTSIYDRQKTAYDQLKADLQVKKNHRQQMRAMLKASNPPDLNKRLLTLSLESQKDKQSLKALNKEWGEKILGAKKNIIEFEGEIEALKKERRGLSRKLHRKVFSHYRLGNLLGEHASMSTFFEDGKPPGGAGDCAAPKLLHYAIQNNLTPLALAEFWWGAQPADGVRHHKHYYPACRGKCRPILPFMLKGLNVQSPPTYGDEFSDAAAPYTIYEDGNFLVVNKPEGLLSVPGKEVEDSVFTRMQQRYPDATGPLLVHRLDMDTSGLLLVAKNPSTHKMLQQQFIEHTIEKRYVAILSKEILQNHRGTHGVVALPLRVDFEDRPRQLVCFSHGKAARTRWEVISQKNGKTRVYFYPHTGRTHQLRVHASHRDGLNASIVGDNLYGESADRLYLHAERLRFINPSSKEPMEFVANVPF